MHISDSLYVLAKIHVLLRGLLIKLMMCLTLKS